MAINYPIVFKVDKKGLGDAENSLKQFGKIAAGVSAAVVAAVGGIAIASVKEFAKFDAALVKSQAIMGDLSDQMKGEMSDAAREVAKTTTFSAEQAAESYYFLASAGLDAASSIEALPAVAQFAQAGMFDMATATDLLTDAQSALGLSIRGDAIANMENMVRVSDTLARASQLANASIEQFSISLTTKAGTALKTVGKDVEEGAAALAVFADQGVKGEIAGTQLTNTIFGLSDRAKAVPGQFEALGISVFDSAGEMRNFADIADDFNGALGDMTTEQKLAEIGNLGFTKQARNGLLLLMENGDALRNYEAELRNAGGTAEEVASNQLLSLEAQLGLLKASFTDLQLEIGGPLGTALGSLVGSFRPLVDLMLPAIADFMTNKVAPGLEVATEAFTKFSDKITGNAALKETTERLEGLGIAVDNVSQAGTGGVIGGMIIEGFQKLGEFITGGGLTDMLNKGVEFRQSLFQTIIDALPGILDAIVAFIPQLLSFITTTLIPSVVSQFNLLVNDVVTLFAELLPQVVTAIAEAVPLLVDTIAQLIPVLVFNLLNQLPVLLDAGIDLFNSLVEALVETFPKLIAAFLDLFPRVLTAIMDQLPKIIDSALTLFDGLITAFLDILPMLIEAIIEAVPLIVGAIVDALPKLIDGAVTLFIGLLDGFLEALPVLMDAVMELVPGVITALTDMIPMLVEASMELWLGIFTALVEATPEIIEGVIELIPEITEALINAVPQLISAGAQLLGGLAKGLIDNAPRILGEAAASVGNTLVNGVKKIFQIQSPSKVFAGIGGDLIDGLDEGLRDGEGLLKDTSFDMAHSFNMNADKAFAQAVPTERPAMMSSSSVSNKSNVLNITVNAGMGADGNRIGQIIVDEILRFEKASGKVFARA